MNKKREPIDKDLPPVTLFTFFLEVGRLLPVPRTQILSYADRTEGWTGWTPQLLSQMLGPGAPPIFSETTVPGFRIAFRDVLASIGTPLYAAEVAYEDWLDAVTPVAVQARRRATRSQIGETTHVRQSIVALTRFIPEAEHPRSKDMTIGWLTEVLRELLAGLNRILDHLSFSARDWALGAVERRDLPAMLPMLVQSTHADLHLNVRGTTFAIPLHDDYPYPEELGEPSFDTEPIQTAVATVISGNHGEQPFESVFRFLRAANSERIAGDTTRAVIELATAMELLFSQLIAVAGTALSWDQQRIDRANSEKTQLRGRVCDHLGTLLKVNIDLTNTTTPWGEWWEQGYGRRNDAVHRGARLNDHDCQAAWAAATRLIAHITTILRLQPTLDSVADRLAALDLSGGPPWLDSPLPVEIDWF